MKWLPGEKRLVACTGKIKYDNGALAARARKLMGKRHSRQAHVSVYRCHFCGCWHLGRAQKRLAKPNQRHQITLASPD